MPPPILAVTLSIPAMVPPSKFVRMVPFQVTSSTLPPPLSTMFKVSVPSGAGVVDRIGAITDGIDHGVAAVTAVDGVVGGSARERIVTSLAIEGIGTGFTVERIVTGPAEQGVVGRTGVDGVVATSTVEHVDTAIEGDGVVTLAADDVLDGGEDIDARCREAADGTSCRDGGTCVGCRKVDGVDPTASPPLMVSLPSPIAAKKVSLPLPPLSTFVAGIAREQVIAATASDVLDVGDGEEAGGHTRGQVHRDGTRRGAVAERVGATLRDRL